MHGKSNRSVAVIKHVAVYAYKLLTNRKIPKVLCTCSNIGFRNKLNLFILTFCATIIIKLIVQSTFKIIFWLLKFLVEILNIVTFLINQCIVAT